MSEKKENRWWKRLMIWLGVIDDVAETAESIREELRRKKKPDESLKFLPWIFLAVLLLSTKAHAAGRAVLTWDQNTESDLAGYKVYMGSASGQYVPPVDVGLTATPQAPRHVIEPLADGAYFFAVTAYDSAGNESAFSNEVSKKIDTASPTPPSGLRVLIEKIIAAIKKLFGWG